ERRLRRQQDELDRDRRNPLPRPLAEERQEALREDPRAGDAAVPLDERTRLRPRIDAAELQRNVGLDCRVEVAGALEPDRPRPVVTPAREQLVRDLAVELACPQPQHVVPEEVLRDHRRVRLELALPPPVGMLQLEESLGPAL